MEILSKNHSSYPRVGDKPEFQKLRRAYNMFDKGKISADEVTRILNSTVNEIIDEQLSSGCDFITDGQIRSADPLSYIGGKIKGIEITGLLRFFDTNFLYRQPKFTGKISSDKPLIADDYDFLRERASNKASVVMFGPYSLLKMSLVKGNFENHLSDLTDIYIAELAKLKKSGAELIQLDEPAILHSPDDFKLMKFVYDKIAESDSKHELLIGLYFGDAGPILSDLNDLPVDGVCFDFTYSPGLTDALNGFAKNIGLGIVDGRNTKMESLTEIVNRADVVLGKVKSAKAYITTSCGLEFLPRNRAYDKLQLCAEAARSLAGV